MLLMLGVLLHGRFESNNNNINTEEPKRLWIVSHKRGSQQIVECVFNTSCNKPNTVLGHTSYIGLYTAYIVVACIQRGTPKQMRPLCSSWIHRQENVTKNDRWQTEHEIISTTNRRTNYCIHLKSFRTTSSWLDQLPYIGDMWEICASMIGISLVWLASCAFIEWMTITGDMP